MIAPTIQQAAADYCRVIHQTRRNGTAQNYQYTMAKFLACLARREVDPTVTPVTALKIGWANWYLGDLREAAAAVSTERGQMSVIRSFFEFAAGAGLEVNMQAYDWKITRYLRKAEQHQRPLDHQAVWTFLSRLDRVTHDLAGWRDRAMFWLAAETGLRVSELVNLVVGDIDWQRATVSIRQGKGGKSSVLPVSEAAMSRLKDYLPRRGVHLPCAQVPGKPSDRTAHLPLFDRLNAGGRSTGQRLTSRGVQTVLAERLDSMGLPAFSPHSLRHFFITNVVRRSGGDMDLARRLARHSSVVTTQIYAHMDADRVSEAYHKLFK